MVAKVFFAKEDAMPRLEALREDASAQAERVGLRASVTDPGWWDECRGDDIVFVFRSGDKGQGRDAANIFAVNASFSGLKPRADWSDST
jgi:hypothetical protein